MDKKTKCPNCGEKLIVIDWEALGFDEVCANEHCPVFKDTKKQYMVSHNFSRDCSIREINGR